MSAKIQNLGKIKIITDVPVRPNVDQQLEDALGFGRYSDTIAEIITNSEPRFAVGIFGGWGTGKTTLMSMIKSKLDQNDKIITVWFEAWRYEREKNLAVIPFLRTFKLRLDEMERSNKGPWGNRVKEGVVQTARAFLGSTKISGGISPFFSVETDLSKARDSFGDQRKIGDDNEIVYYHGTYFLKKALEDVREIDKSYRIVVFIDDLDRCFPEKALEVLESVKSLFDIDGIIFVIAMDSNSIETYVKNKYGGNTAIRGIDYLQKIVQLPFQVGWKDEDVYKSIEKIVSTELKDYPLMNEIKNNLNLIVKGVQLNPREIKRFVNSVILAVSVYFPDGETSSIRDLIAVQALSFRNDWKNFLDIITPDDSRQTFLTHYKEFRKLEKEQNIIVPTLEETSLETSQKAIDFFQQIHGIYDQLYPKAQTESLEHDKRKRLRNDLKEFYIEYIKQGEDLRMFLEAGADNILLDIKQMEKYRRALATTKHKTSRLTSTDIELMYSCWRYAEKDTEFKRKMYQFHVIVNASKTILEQIESVTYRLPSSWKDRAVQTMTEQHRSTNFKLKELAWGSFTLKADVKINGQDDLVTLSLPIMMKEESPRLPV